MSDPVFVLKAEEASEPFVFEWQGERYSIPHVRDLDVFAVREDIESATDENDYIWQLLHKAIGEDAWSRLREQGMTQQTFKQLVTAWRQHCGLLEGESTASSD